MGDIEKIIEGIERPATPGSVNAPDNSEIVSNPDYISSLPSTPRTPREASWPAHTPEVYKMKRPLSKVTTETIFEEAEEVQDEKLRYLDIVEEEIFDEDWDLTNPRVDFDLELGFWPPRPVTPRTPL